MFQKITENTMSQHTSNEVIRRIGIERGLLMTIKPKKIASLEQIYRNDKYILQLIIDGKVKK